MRTRSRSLPLASAAFVSLSFAFALALAVAACGNDSFGSRAADETDAAPPDTDADIDAGEINAPPKAPPGCDGALLPTQDACVVDEGLGTFVSKSLGNDATGNGSRAKPYATLQKAITAAGATKRRVYACAESYTQSIVLVEGVSVFGYFDCANGWKPDASHHAAITGTDTPTVKANGLTAPIRFDGFDVEAPAATQAGASSIAMIAANTKALVVANGKLTAKNASAGANGVQGPIISNASTVNGTDGKIPGSCSINPSACQLLGGGGAGGTNACAGISGVVGGPGGGGGFGGHYKRANANWSVLQNPTGGEGGTTQTAFGGGEVAAGQNGANGPDGTNGKSATSGVVTADGWTPGDGTNGTNGSPGQGGGGGAGHSMDSSEGPTDGDYYGYSGAGGGAGGCPGTAGTAGKGGGASIALISWNSGVRLESVAVQAGNGGNGGQGATGTAPWAGGAGATSPTQHYQCKGGNGGWGGHSGWSGHGAGGPSIGVAYKGALPDLGGATPVIGAAGKGQPAKTISEVSVPTFTKQIPASSDGVAQPTWSIP